MPPSAKPRSGGKWKPAPLELVETFHDAIRSLPGAEIRKMFGYPAAFVKGNMLGGLFQDSMMLRLSPSDRAEIQDRAGATPFEPVPGRVMREYIVVPPKIVNSGVQLRAWLGKSFGYTSSLPAKSRKAKPKKR